MKKIFVLVLDLFLVVTILLVLPLYVLQAGAAELHVDPNGIVPDGSSCYVNIQSAIYSANTGDAIIVHPGTYNEEVNFLGKAITVRSITPNDMAVVTSTIIDGGRVYFINGEGIASVLNGITVQNIHAPFGSGICCSHSSPSIVNCIIRKNSFYSWNQGFGSGGIACANSSPSITNCIISENRVYCPNPDHLYRSRSGGGIYCYQNSSPRITNCLIVKNTVDGRGGGICSSGTEESPIITNCIIRDNHPMQVASKGIITHSNIQGVDPLFVNPNSGDYRLQCGSPCIDAGTNDGAPDHDIVGLSRPQDGDGDGVAICDIGIFEYNFNPCEPKSHHVYPGGNIQDTINSANCGDVIIIHEGTYIENINFGGKGITLKSNDPNDPAVVAATIIDGGQAGSVVTFNNEVLFDSVLSGITLRNGNSDSGGGINCSYSSPVISKCIINGNIGSGIYCNNGSLDFIRCTISKNNGKGIFCTNSTISITDCTIQKNNDDGISCTNSTLSISNCSINKNNGSGIFCSESPVKISNCSISENDSWGISCSSASISNCTIIGNKGGGISCFSSSESSVNYCTISQNSEGGGISCGGDISINHCIINGNSAYSGGGISCSSSPSITNCTISGNSASYGGGISCGSSLANIHNCIIVGNSANISGGGMYCSNSTPSIINCTFNGNSSSDKGGGISCYKSVAIVTNCIIWNNIGDQISGGATVAYSNIQGGIFGTGNINSLPLFVNPDLGDFHLQFGSPCIDTGNNEKAPDQDIDSVSMPQDGDNDGIAICDMGAYEFIGIPYTNDKQPPVPDIDPLPDIQIECGIPLTLPTATDDYAGPVIATALDPLTYTIKGTYTVTWIYDDRNGNITTQTQAIIVDDIIPPVPDLESLSDIEIRCGFPLIPPTATDNCAGLVIATTNDPLIYTIEGTYTVNWTYDDGNGNMTTQSQKVRTINYEEIYVSPGESIQGAIDSAGYHDVIILQQGIYYENINFLGKAITLRSTDPNNPDIVAKTIVDGDQKGSVVTFDNGEGNGSVLNGITLQNGKADNGSGIICSLSSSPKITNCIIKENLTLKGAAIYCYYFSSPKITNCIITGNSSSLNIEFSGGISCRSSSSPEISHCTITNNMGTGISCFYSSPSITNCTITGNSTRYNGGGIYCDSSSPSITNCTITENSVYDKGGGICCCSSSSPSITNCMIAGNSTRNNGGGIFCDFSSLLNIVNCIIAENSSSQDGGGIYCYDSSPIIINCTIKGNSAYGKGGGICCNDSSSPSSPIITNCILWNNFPEDIYGGTPQINYSDVQHVVGLDFGEGNIHADPLFLGAEARNYYLRPDSPCIDMGTYIDAPQEDREGFSRPQGLGIDMGAYEYVGRNSCIPRASFTADQTEGVCSLTVNFDASASSGSQCNAPLFSWDFGDGTVVSNLNEATVSHTYTAHGFYDVSLIISTESGSHRLVLHDFIKVNSSEPTRYVGQVEGEYDHTSIQEAIDAADNGEVILVNDGTYFENINFKGKWISVYSKNGAASTIIDGRAEGSVVTFNHREDTHSLLEGFTIQNGSFGGIYCSGSSPKINNCTISGNSSHRESGIYCINSSPIIINCTINSNNGNGIYCEGPTSPFISNCIISGNNGRGICCANNSSPVINNCIINKNDSGGILCFSSFPSISNCTISRNSAESGAGIYFSNSSPIIHNCVISENTAQLHGGGCFCSYSSCIFTNCTFIGNLATYSGVIYCSSSITIKNSILWNNLPQEITGTCDVTYSNIQQASGVYPGIGNINADPFFVGSEAGNYYLRPESPCIDTGTFIDAPLEDRDRIIRPQGAGIDMGAYEYVDPNSCIPRASFTANQNIGTDTLTVEFDASSSGSSLNTEAIFSWEFGDGTSESDPNALIISHTYADYGAYDVSLTISTKSGSHRLVLHNFIKVKSSQPTREVGEEGKYDYFLIQEAIDDAGYGEMILVHDGTYIENINFNGKGITICSENGAYTTIIDGRANGHVVTFDNKEGIDSVLDGFTIQNGFVSSVHYSACGGGVYCNNASPTINNCIIRRNSVRGYYGYGGGIYCYRCSPKITNCIITENSVANNYNAGGGIYCKESSPSIINCIISKNFSKYYGGGISCKDSSPIITNCTISGNNAYGIYSESSLTITNCILWGNSPNEINTLNSVHPIVVCSNIQQDSSVYPGIDNINTDPLFVESETGNYYLSPNSPCIDRGNSSNAPLEDKEGIMRPQGEGVDIGAYEYVDPNFATPRASFTSDQIAGMCPLTVWFDASSSGSSQYSEASYSWDFGDGTSIIDSNSATISHTYTDYGFYDVSLAITTEYGSHQLMLHDFIKIKASKPTREVRKDAGEYDHTSIQEAIDKADKGEMILVHDGIYYENIIFKGKWISVCSKNGPVSTIIDGRTKGSVVTFDHREDKHSVLKGFTLTNGSGTNKGWQGILGGGIYCNYSSPSITNCIIRKNLAEEGGGIYCGSFSSPIISGCLINGNFTELGGGIYCSSSTSSSRIINCTINGNYAKEEGGGIHCNFSTIITNCTICDNSAYQNKGGGIYCYKGDPSITNCILWDNSPQEIYGSVSKVTYSNIQWETGTCPGEGNVNADPLFVGSDAGNYYLSPNSPCIDMGNASDAPSIDKEGIIRPQGTGVDIGAYEYVNPSICIPRASFKADQTFGTGPLTVEFDASSSGASQCNGFMFSWDFGDGTTAKDLNIPKVSHTYSSHDSYDVSLTIANEFGSHKLTLYDFIEIFLITNRIDVGEGYAYTSIQNAIDDAGDGWIILVHDGTYFENINFKGKRIRICSENGPASTIIDGKASGNVVTFDHREGIHSVLEGFTIQNAYRGVYSHGGGIYCNDSSPSINNCIIRKNRESGIYCKYSSPNITNCIINKNNKNLPSNNCGGIYCLNSAPSIINCIISENFGDGICSDVSSPSIINCTVSGNFSSSGGGINGNNSIIMNSVFWGNSPNEISGTHKVTFSNIQQKDGIYPGEGNINAAPLFIGNYYLSPDSPCINIGTFINAPLMDKEGIVRPQGVGIDIGAYEYVDSNSCIPRASFKADQTRGIDTLTVELDASSSGGSQYSGVMFSWDFGDGSSESCPNASSISHTYNDYGFYDVSLIVTTDCGSHKLTLYDFIKIKSSQPTREVGERYAYTSIQKAIDDAGNGELILVHDGTYAEKINFKDKGITVCSENGAATTIIDGEGDGPCNEAALVVFNNIEDKDSTLDGFSIQNGLASGCVGISCNRSSSPTITNCIISKNLGGISCTVSSPSIINCIIEENSTSDRGGGISCNMNSSPVISNCIISGNSAKNFGGAIYCNSSNPRIYGCSIRGNTTYAGAGISCDFSSPDIINCTITENSANEAGGGIYCFELCTPNILNCTISRNSARLGSGISYFYNSSPHIRNCIIWDNLPYNIRPINFGRAFVTYCNIQGVFSGRGNFDANPLFVDPNAGDYHLTPNSPCIDKGDPNSTIDKDKDGVPRPQGLCDIGAYEFDYSLFNTYYRDADSDGYGNPNDTIKDFSCPLGYEQDSSDCDDADPNINPGAPEQCEGKDNDCDGKIDEDLIRECSTVCDTGIEICQNGEWIGCNAPQPTEEVCDGKDNDCNGKIDELPECSDPRIVRIINTQGYPGQKQVFVPVEIENALGIARIDIVLSYDPDILLAQEVRPGFIIKDFLIHTNIEQDSGKVNLLINNTTGITANRGDLVEIIFDVAEFAEVGTVVPLEFEKLQLNDENADLCSAISINGEFLIVEEGYKGDLNKDKDITSADAIIILQIAVGLRNPDEYQLWAGDVNDDGYINSADAILVLKAAVKMPTIFYADPKNGLAGDLSHIFGWNFGDKLDDSLIHFGDIPAEPISWSDNEIIVNVPSGIQAGPVYISIDTAEGSSNLYTFTIEQDQMSRLRGSINSLY